MTVQYESSNITQLKRMLNNFNNIKNSDKEEILKNTSYFVIYQENITMTIDLYITDTIFLTISGIIIGDSKYQMEYMNLYGKTLWKI